MSEAARMEQTMKAMEHQNTELRNELEESQRQNEANEAGVALMSPRLQQAEEAAASRAAALTELELSSAAMEEALREEKRIHEQAMSERVTEAEDAGAALMSVRLHEAEEARAASQAKVAFVEATVKAMEATMMAMEDKNTELRNQLQESQELSCAALRVKEKAVNEVNDVIAGIRAEASDEREKALQQQTHVWRQCRQQEAELRSELAQAHALVLEWQQGCDASADTLRGELSQRLQLEVDLASTKSSLGASQHRVEVAELASKQLEKDLAGTKATLGVPQH